ncbi:LysR family transcriptional regulator [Tessaracoccus defluvii]
MLPDAISNAYGWGVDPRRLLIFRAIARAGSLSAGARELGWTQPAVSQQVHRLEREAGTQLFIRSTRGVELTDAGQALMRQADAIASHLDAARTEMDAYAEGRRGRVRLVAFPTALAAVVPDALAGLARTHPGIDVTIDEAEPPEAVEAIRSGDADLALTFRYAGEPFDPDLPATPIGTEPLRLVLPAGHRAVESLEDLADEPWVAGCERCRIHLLNVCSAAGFTPRIQHTTDDYVVVQALVARGLGVAILPDSALRAYRHPGTEAVELPGIGERILELVARPGTERVAAVAAVTAALTPVA